MSDGKETIASDSQLPANVSDQLIVINLSGKDPEIWRQRCKRFYWRIRNSVKRIFNSDIPPLASSDAEIRTVSDLMTTTALGAIKTPALKNMERQAAIRLKLAEAREKEASARMLELEGDKLELQLEGVRRKVLESQRLLDLAIQRGEIVVSEQDGAIVILIREAPSITK